MRDAVILEKCSSCWTKDGSDFCEYCTAKFCARCYRAHDCFGHEPEMVPCVSCQAECELSTNKLGYETRPALVNGDPVCASCAYHKPWEKKT